MSDSPHEDLQPMQMGLSIGVADKKMRGRQRRGPWDLWLRINPPRA